MTTKNTLVMVRRITKLKVRYRVPVYAEWCSWHTYPAVDTETVVDLFYPIFSDGVLEFNLEFGRCSAGKLAQVPMWLAKTVFQNNHDPYDQIKDRGGHTTSPHCRDLRA